MEPLAQQALDRLTLKNSTALAELAQLVVDQVSHRPIIDIIDPKWLAQQLRLSLDALTSGDQAREWVLTQWDTALRNGQEDTRSLRTWAPDESVALLQELLSRPFEPSQAFIERFLDQPAVRDLLQMVLEDALRRFTQKAKRLEDGMLGGLGGNFAGRGRNLGKGILG